jgi:hypothetical protein
VESTFIKLIPDEKRLNANTPRVRDMSLVSEECKVILKTAINNP